ncbi:MAG: hypothetical protein KatS3mg111_3605 [Pirellulaceae bacterium]|nr:MAG: hypothetical protein KatS3mg111_3605 [Pirellulaceae bacterium]
MATGMVRKPRSATAQSAVLVASVLSLVAVLCIWLVLRLTMLQNSRHSPLPSYFDSPSVVSWKVPYQSPDDLLSLTEQKVDEVVREFPNSAAAFSARGKYHYLISKKNAAKADWQRAIELDASWEDGILGLAELAFEEGRYEEAIDLCLQLRTRSQDDPRVPLLLADAYLSNGQAQEAMLTLQQHITKETTSLQALELLGQAHAALGQLEEAQAVYEKALQFAPDNKEILYGLGQVYGRLGDREKSRQYMDQFRQRAVSKAAENVSKAKGFTDIEHAKHIAAQTFFDCALVYKMHGNWPNAEKLVAQSLLLVPDVAVRLYELQRILHQTGKIAEAIDIGQRIVSLDPEDVNQWLVLGGLYAEIEMAEESLQAFRRAVALAPDDPRCKRARAILRSINEGAGALVQ